MNKISYLWLGVAFVVCFFVVGFPLWQIPYSKVSLPDTLYGVELLIVPIAAACSRIFGKARMKPAVFIVGSAVPGAVFARVCVEVAADPTSHNLWPFELIIALMVGLAGSMAGALVGSLSIFVSSKMTSLKNK